jgi:folate-binding protein YgfZ
MKFFFWKFVPLHVIPRSMSLVRLNRSLIRLSGERVVNFLQGLVTQDVVAGHAAGARCMGSLFLNPKGRVISESLISFGTDSVLLDVPETNSEMIASMLTRHKLRLAIKIEKCEDLFVCADLESSNDPRSPEMPGRKYVGKEKVFDGDEKRYRKLRILAGVAEGSDEIPKDSIVPIFYNFDLLNCISFTKGCYTGQELVTRTLRRGIVRKRLFPITGNVRAGDSVCYKGEKLGELIVAEGGVGLAQLSLPSNYGLNDVAQIRETLKAIDMDQFSVGSDRVNLVVPHYMR